MGEKVRVSDAERAEWHAKARSVGLTLADLVGGGHKAAAEAVEVVAHLVVIESARSGLADQPELMQRADTWRTVRLAGSPLPMICAPPAPWVMAVYAREIDKGCRCAPRRPRRAHRLATLASAGTQQSGPPRDPVLQIKR